MENKKAMESISEEEAYLENLKKILTIRYKGKIVHDIFYPSVEIIVDEETFGGRKDYITKAARHFFSYMEFSYITSRSMKTHYDLNLPVLEMYLDVIDGYMVFDLVSLYDAIICDNKITKRLYNRLCKYIRYTIESIEKNRMTN